MLNVFDFHPRTGGNTLIDLAAPHDTSDVSLVRSYDISLRLGRNRHVDLAHSIAPEGEMAEAGAALSENEGYSARECNNFGDSVRSDTIHGLAATPDLIWHQITER